MDFLNPFHSPIAAFQYALIILIVILGIRQYDISRKGGKINKSFVVPLGAICLIIGFLGLILQVKQAFEAIEVAGDISPQIVASGIKAGYDYPIMGLVGIAISYAFRFINSSMTINSSDDDLM